MNFFFFLDTTDNNLTSSVEIFNRPAALRLCKDKLLPKNIVAFYTDGKKWISKKIQILDPYQSKIIYKKDLPSEMHNKSVFICLSDNDKINEKQIINENYMNSSPAWRANIKISSENNSTSYQGEYPHAMTNKKLSLVSCSPMIQNPEDAISYFYLVNLKSNPEKKIFNLKMLDINKKVLKEFFFKTNSINTLCLNDIVKENKQLTYIFSSEDEGGIPIYFSQSKDKLSFSLEHTHPPTEYTFEGNRILFQKKKKSFWHN